MSLQDEISFLALVVLEMRALAHLFTQLSCPPRLEQNWGAIVVTTTCSSCSAPTLPLSLKKLHHTALEICQIFPKERLEFVLVSPLCAPE